MKQFKYYKLYNIYTLTMYCAAYNILKSKNPDKDYPTNMGQKWTIEEEQLLLEASDKNINIDVIAQTHNRTVGGIIGRQKDISYKMYLQNVSIEEIIIKTKLNKEIITETITKKDNASKRANTKPTSTLIHVPKQFSLENEVNEMKTDIKELKNTIKELVEMMKALYEFEDA